MNIAYISFQNKMLEAYLRALYKAHEGEIPITEHRYIGALISRLARTSERPTPKPEGGIPLALPEVSHQQHRSRYYLYYTQYDMAAIETILEGFWHLDLMTTIQEGREIGMGMKACINAFLEELDSPSPLLNFEQLRRMVTRERKRKREMLLSQKRMYGFTRLVR